MLDLSAGDWLQRSVVKPAAPNTTFRARLPEASDGRILWQVGGGWDGTLEQIIVRQVTLKWRIDSRKILSRRWQYKI